MPEYIFTIEQIRVISAGIGAGQVAAEGKVTSHNREMAIDMLAKAEKALRQGKKVGT